MVKLERKTPMTLQEFMNKTYTFVNVEDTLRALIAPRESKLDQAERRSKETRSDKGCENEVKTRNIHTKREEIVMQHLRVRALGKHMRT